MIPPLCLRTIKLLALNHTPSSPNEPHVTTSPLLPADQLLAGDRRQLLRLDAVSAWFTKDSWRDELATRHPGDITRLVRHVASNHGVALRLSCYWGGEAYFQSRIAPVRRVAVIWTICARPWMKQPRPA